jgi:hypothetical protein
MISSSEQGLPINWYRIGAVVHANCKCILFGKKHHVTFTKHFFFKKNFTKQFPGVDHKIQPRYCSPATNYILMPANSSILWPPETLYMAHGQHNQHVVEQGSPE